MGSLSLFVLCRGSEASHHEVFRCCRGLASQTPTLIFAAPQRLSALPLCDHRMGPQSAALLLPSPLVEPTNPLTGVSLDTATSHEVSRPSSGHHLCGPENPGLPHPAPSAPGLPRPPTVYSRTHLPGLFHPGATHGIQRTTGINFWFACRAFVQPARALTAEAIGAPASRRRVQASLAVSLRRQLRSPPAPLAPEGRGC